MIAEQLELPFGATVWFEPCAAWRIPLEGDLLTCAVCGYWVEDHDRDETR